jgi:hypothetical protein
MIQQLALLMALSGVNDTACARAWCGVRQGGCVQDTK